jgi:hypothetical protein
LQKQQTSFKLESGKQPICCKQELKSIDTTDIEPGLLKIVYQCTICKRISKFMIVYSLIQGGGYPTERIFTKIEEDN